MQTHIYISLSSKAPKVQDRVIGYLITADKREYSIEDYTIVTASWQRAYLIALNAALERFNPSIPCEITIHMPDKGIVADFNKNMPNSWQMNAWRNKRGKEIRNRDQWQKLYNQTYMQRRWKVEMIYDLHKYIGYMDQQMERADERAI